MSYRITVEPSGATFDASAEETLLEAALRQGVLLPYGCKDGACGACKATLRQGEVERGAHQPQALDAADLAAGRLLLCTARARSDLVIENRQARRADLITPRLMPARVERLERLAPDVIELGLRLPASENFRFHAGQYVDILLKDGLRRSYSIANLPEKTGVLELHIRHVPGGLFTEQVFQRLKLKDILRIEGPLGSFYLREDSDKPAILLASGTGFAPIRAIVEHAIAQGSRRSFHLYWGGRRAVDLYRDTEAKAWAAAHANFRYTPVLSEPDADWSGRTGLVHAAVLADYPDLAGHQVYACGAPVMVDAARRDFIDKAGLPAEEFFADAFTFATPRP